VQLIISNGAIQQCLPTSSQIFASISWFLSTPLIIFNVLASHSESFKPFEHKHAKYSLISMNSFKNLMFLSLKLNLTLVCYPTTKTRTCMCNVILWCVRTTNVTMKTQQCVPFVLLLTYTCSHQQYKNPWMLSWKHKNRPLCTVVKLLCILFTIVNNIHILRSSCKVPVIFVGYSQNSEVLYIFL
jgi:hypothetical protein